MSHHLDRDGVTAGEDDAESGRIKSSPMAASTHQQVSQPGIAGTGKRRRSRPSLAKTKRSLSHDADTDILLQPPTSPSQPHTTASNNQAQGPGSIEAAVWDWQAPSQPNNLDSSDSTSAYFYEPQGELLLHERADPTGARANEFSIPDPVVSGNKTPRPTNPLEVLFADGVSSESNARTGAKRKSAPDLSCSLISDTAKRPALDMSGSKAGGSANTQSHKTAQRTQSFDRRTLPPSHSTGLPNVVSTALALPARKVFPIQIGDKLFRLSGASISSDGE